MSRSKFGTLINAKTQIIDGSIDKALLDTSIQSTLDQVAINQASIAAMEASKGQANGIATLGADGKLVNSQVPALAVSEFIGEATSEAAMLAQTTTAAGTPINSGDWCNRTDTNETWMFAGGAVNDINNWKRILTPQDGVTSLSNASGTVSSQKGNITLADVAFSGEAGDVKFSDSNYTATDVKGALVEVMGKAAANETAISNIEGDITNITNQMGNKLDASKLVNAVDCTGTIDGTNKAFTVPANVATITAVYIGGQRMRPTVDYTIAGNVVTFNASPDYEMQRPFVDGIAA